MPLPTVLVVVPVLTLLYRIACNAAVSGELDLELEVDVEEEALSISNGTCCSSWIYSCSWSSLLISIMALLILINGGEEVILVLLLLFT